MIQQTSLFGMIEEAIEQLPRRGQRKRFERRWNRLSEEQKVDVADEMAEMLCKCDSASFTGDPSFGSNYADKVAACVNCEDFGTFRESLVDGSLEPNDQFGLNVETIRAILELVVEFLPIILGFFQARPQMPAVAALIGLLLLFVPGSVNAKTVAPLPMVAAPVPLPVPVVAYVPPQPDDVLGCGGRTRSSARELPLYEPEPEPKISPAWLEMLGEAEEEPPPQDSGKPQPGKLVSRDCPGGVCPVQVLPSPREKKSTVSLSSATPVSSTYNRQWYNHDGLSLREHAELMHGHDTTGLSASQVAYLNDRDHNRWGSGYHYAEPGTFASRPVLGSPVRLARSFADRRPVIAAPFRWIAALRERRAARIQGRIRSRWGR